MGEVCPVEEAGGEVSGSKRPREGEEPEEPKARRKARKPER